MKEDFKTLPAHTGFLAKRLFGPVGRIIDGATAYLEPGGGGPVQQHTHAADHLFIVASGEAKIRLGGEEVIVRENESFLVKGNTPHSVWNNTDRQTVMIGISVRE